VLRQLALDSLVKRGNIEGAALFAVLSPRAHRHAAVRALVAFQAAYNYLDTLAEQPSADPVANGRRLHEALLLAFDPDAVERDHYAGAPWSEDGGYLAATVDTCRAALAELPSRATVAPAAHAAAMSIVGFQSLNLTKSQGEEEGLERWAGERTPAGSGLRWWQTAAACGSSLPVHVLIALAASPTLDGGEVAAVGGAYFPWIGALHSLLDSLVDVDEDERSGQRNLLVGRAPADEEATQMRLLAERAMGAASVLPRGREHTAILTAMAGYYLSASDASRPARATAENVREVLGGLMGPTLALFRIRRLCAWIVHAVRG
jgi:tetraprenyl-beta-curcumene synthase